MSKTKHTTAAVRGGLPGTVYFDLKVSNDVVATVSIRHLDKMTWIYEIHSGGVTSKRGSMRWVPKDFDHPEYLYLVMKVLGDHYANLSQEGVWQEIKPIEEF